MKHLLSDRRRDELDLPLVPDAYLRRTASMAGDRAYLRADEVAGYLAAAAESGDVTAYRRYWELAALVGLRDGLRSGDVCVPGSRRYADPASFLLTPEAWAAQNVEFCHLVGKPGEAADALAVADEELHTACADLETQLAKGNSARSG